MDLTISIVNYNTRDLLRACLRSIFEHPPPGEWEVVVVDNGSSDGSLDLLAQEFPQVRTHATGRNLGYAAANNLVLRDLTARYALVLNSDIEVRGEALARLLAFMDTHAEAGLCTARLMLPDGSLQPAWRRGFTLGEYFAQQVFLDRLGWARRFCGGESATGASLTEPYGVRHIHGACLFVRAEALKAVGLMDEGYWMYCEDSDWCLRLRRAGWQLCVEPQAEMLHAVGGSSTTIRAEMIARYHHSAARYFRRHYGPVAGLAARALGLFSPALRLLLWSAATAATVGLSARTRQQRGLFARALALTARAPAPVARV